RREIKSGEFNSRQIILEALGGDAGKFQRGEATTMKLRDDELPVLRGVESWTSIVQEGVKAKREQLLLTFLKDEPAMKIYIAFSKFPDEAMKKFGAEIGRAHV